MRQAFIVFTMLLLASMQVSAHPGHGEMSLFGHDGEHLLWLVSVVGMSILVLLVVKRFKRR